MKLTLMKPDGTFLAEIADFCTEFAEKRMRVTYDERQIPGMNGLENYDSIAEWLQYCETMAGKISWFMTVRENDRKIVGFICIRHKLEYDDDDPAFASHIGYCIRPSERGNGYAKEQLRLGLEKARKFGIKTVRLICSDSNLASSRTILANGGVYLDTIYGEESGLRVNRYDIVIEGI